jgi:hypothetical protein
MPPSVNSAFPYKVSILSGCTTRLNQPATASEAIQSANLDWKVVKLPLFAGSKRIAVPDRFAVVRRTGDLIQKTDPVLGVVSNEYTPLQNRQAFQFFDPIVGQDAAIYHTAGALGNGERVAGIRLHVGRDVVFNLVQEREEFNLVSHKMK